MTDTLKFVLVYREDGIPIFTKCFSEFCSDLFKDPARLTTFLSTLETISEELSDEKSLKSIQVSNFIMKFKRTAPSRHSIVLGIESKSNELFKAIFRALSILLENKYQGKDWSVMDQKFREELDRSITKNALLPAFHGFNVSYNDCSLNNNCPLFILEHKEIKKAHMEFTRSKIQ